MDRAILKSKLDDLGIAPIHYSLDGGLMPDCIILFHFYHAWEVFYLDERGGRNNKRNFESEHEACEYILTMFAASKDLDSNLRLKA